MTSRRVLVHGRVQTGWVRNRRDGTVEAELHGAPDDVDAVLTELRRGPEHARVDRIEVTAIDESTVAEFEFRPTI